MEENNSRARVKICYFLGAFFKSFPIPGIAKLQITSEYSY